MMCGNKALSLGEKCLIDFCCDLENTRVVYYDKCSSIKCYSLMHTVMEYFSKGILLAL